MRWWCGRNHTRHTLRARPRLGHRFTRQSSLHVDCDAPADSQLAVCVAPFTILHTRHKDHCRLGASAHSSLCSRQAARAVVTAAADTRGPPCTRPAAASAAACGCEWCYSL